MKAIFGDVPIGAVLLDMDGTLLDTEPVYAGAMLSALASLGYAVPEPMVRAMVGLPGAECIAMLKAHFGGAFDVKHFHGTYIVHRDERLLAGIPLKSGVLELLDHLTDLGLPSAVATSASRSNAEANLTRTGLRNRFEYVFTRDDVARGKPDPALFLRAAEAVGVPPAACLAVEDSHVGVRAAHAAGTVPIMVPDLLEATPEIAELCAAVLEDLHELRALLRPREVVA
jgi:HAD superfamily hydrolase (TIGR01509 family)